MSHARTRILAAIRAATVDVPAGERPAYEWAAPPAPAADRDLLAERIADYGAAVTRVDDVSALPDAIASALGRHGARRIAIAPDLPVALHPPRLTLLPDDPPLDHDALSAADGVLTTAALAVAETGTIVLDAGPGQGRRALTLLPDLHVCVVRADQVRQTVSEAVAELAAVDRPITFISGPSATSDIEFHRVEGVHGPRRLEVVILAEAPSRERGQRGP